MNPAKRRERAKRKAQALRNGTFRRSAEGRGKLKLKEKLKAARAEAKRRSQLPIYTVVS